MENNNGNQTNSVPTVSEIMNEVSQITANQSSDVPSVDSISMPTVADIVMPSQTEAAPVQPTPVQTMPVQTAPAQTMPVQTAPVQTVPSYAPVQTAYAPVQNNVPKKRSVGRTICLIFGILIALVGAFMTFAIAVVDIDAYVNEGQAEIVLPAYVTMLLILALGIVLIVIGAKKTEPNVSFPTANGVNFTTVNTDVPSQSSVPVAPQTTYAATTGATGAQIPTTQANYQYAPAAMIQDETEKVMKKRARNFGLGAIGLVALFWVLIFALDRASLWLIIFPFVLSFGSLKLSGGRSVSGWIGMIGAILSVVIFVLGLALTAVG